MSCSARVYRRTNRQRTAISSLTVALLRLADETDGAISIDGVDTASVSLQRLRSSIALIPQAATMFAGSLKHKAFGGASGVDACPTGAEPSSASARVGLAPKRVGSQVPPLTASKMV